MTRKIATTLESLCKLATKLVMPDRAMEDELWDVCESDARSTHKDITSQPLYDQLKFLHEHGYTLSRLKELIEEAAGFGD